MTHASEDMFEVDDPFADFNIDAFDVGKPGADRANAQPGGRLEADIDEIEPDPDQVRQHFDEDEIQAMADSFVERRDQGLKVILSAIQVWPLPSDQCHGRVRFRIAQGETRWRAAVRAKESRVPIEHVGEITVLDQMTENGRRKNLNVVDTANGIAKLLAQGLTQVQIGKALGEPKNAVSEYKVIAGGPECVRGLVSAGRVESRRVLYELTLAHRQASEVVEQWLTASEAGADKVTEARVGQLREEIARRAARSDAAEAEVEATSEADEAMVSEDVPVVADPSDEHVPSDQVPEATPDRDEPSADGPSVAAAPLVTQGNAGQREPERDEVAVQEPPEGELRWTGTSGGRPVRLLGLLLLDEHGHQVVVPQGRYVPGPEGEVIPAALLEKAGL